MRTQALQLAHISDIHFGPAAAQEVQRCADYVAMRLNETKPDAILLSGDLFDHRLEAHAPAFRDAVHWVQRLANIAPVLILQGTFSHDVPGMLDILRVLSANHGIAVASEEGAWRLSEGAWDHVTSVTADDQAIAYTWPPVNRGKLAVEGDLTAAYRRYVAGVQERAVAIAAQARELGVPSILTSHGTVNGCVTEHGQTLLSPDHEFGVAELISFGFDAVALGHIHKHQSWSDGAQVVAYAGSLGRLHGGDYDPKGWINWSIKPGDVAFVLETTPARDMIEVICDGLPNMEELRAIAATAQGAFVRIRYTVASEQSELVDRKAITALFESAAVCKVEGTIVPRMQARAPEIAAANGVPAKLRLWAQHQGIASTRELGLSDCLQQLLCVENDEAIADNILQTLMESKHETEPTDTVGV